MIKRLAASILLCAVHLIQTEVAPHQISVTGSEVGGNFTFHFPVLNRLFHLYKQSLGYKVQLVLAVIDNKLTIGEKFKKPRFKVTERKSQYSLTITNVSKEDEATYFILTGLMYSLTLANFTFLAVNDRNQQKSFYVKQSPETESVRPGDSVTLRCSLHSKNKEDPDQCPGDRSVYWIRSGSGGSQPGIIYTHNSEEEDRSCAYSLSKTIQSSSDAGTYYCAVVTCGQILFGEGTKVVTESINGCDSGLKWTVIVLGVLLVCCVTVTVGLIIYGHGRTGCRHCKGPTSASNHQDGLTADPSNDPDGGVNYAALNFSTRKVKRGTRKTRESQHECVYSVTVDNRNQQHHFL